MRIHTFAVTFGLPSLSPPIQDPNLMGVLVNGNDLPVCCTMSTFIKKPVYVIEMHRTSTMSRLVLRTTDDKQKSDMYICMQTEN